MTRILRKSLLLALAACGRTSHPRTPDTSAMEVRAAQPNKSLVSRDNAPVTQQARVDSALVASLGREMVANSHPRQPALTRRVLPADSTTSSDTSYGTYGHEPTVTIVIGSVRIPVGVDSSFEELKRALPKPALLPPEHLEDHMHSNDRYCYAFRGGFLVIEDADEGIWKGSLTRTAPSKSACPAIDAVPTISLGDHLLSLGMRPSSINAQTFEGFTPVMRNAHMLERRWWYVSQASDGRTWCSNTSIDIHYANNGSVLTSVSVDNGGEGWGARRVERPEGSRDSVWTCHLD